MVETKSIATAFREHGGHGNHMWLPCERDAFITLRNIKKIETILYGARFYQALRQRCNRGVTAYIINPATSNIHRMYERSVTQNVTFSSLLCCTIKVRAIHGTFAVVRIIARTLCAMCRSVPRVILAPSRPLLTHMQTTRISCVLV